ncbi:MAG TPA: hypothetical protein VNL77_08700 [Roseiflexaceae bacterium]|nr:hypothetical protein [Roseiflexaceae bacterium]
MRHPEIQHPYLRRLLTLLALIVAAPAVQPVAGAASAAASPFPAAVVLYDGRGGTTPDAQGFTFLTIPPLAAAATQSYDPIKSWTSLDSMPVTGESAGYFARVGAVPELDRTAGYTVSLTLQLVAEQHAGSDRNQDGRDDRAGFSLTVLGSDLRGIELGFWQGRVWAQDDGRDDPEALFTQAEGAAFDTSAALATYELRVLGEGYTLLAGGAPLLSGRLRDYTAFEPGPLQPDPYETPNLVFLGDNTSSAAARIHIAAVSLGVGGRALALPLLYGKGGG